MGNSRIISVEVSALSNLVKRLRPVHGEFGEGDITNMQRWFVGVIRSLGTKKDVFQGDLEKYFNITRATASSILKRMEQNGLITRTSVSHDARLKKITLTERAIKYSDAAQEHMDKSEEMMIEGIPQEDIDTFFSVLDRIKENINRFEK